MDPAPAPYLIWISEHLGATVLSAFPALVPQHHGVHTVLTGHRGERMKLTDAHRRSSYPMG